MNIEITQEAQDKFRSDIIDKIKQHFPIAEIKNIDHFSVGQLFPYDIKNISMKSAREDGEIPNNFHFIIGHESHDFSWLMHSIFYDIGRLRFFKEPVLVLIRCVKLSSRMIFESPDIQYNAVVRLILVYDEIQKD